ncbi:MAG: FGGY family carbohydrate kinase [Thioalkalispiraceae bacterium]
MYNNKSLFLCIDQGGHASRAMVYDLEGNVVAKSASPLTTRHPKPYFVEHDAEQLIASLRECLSVVFKELGERARHIEAAGLATQRSNIVCWDKHSGKALSPVISWQDTRGHEWMTSLDLEREDIHKTTGLFPSAHYGASKLRWCLDNIDEVKTALAEQRLCCGPMSSYIVNQLIGTHPFVADPVSASRTLLWHLHRKDWDQYLLDSFGIPREILPECVASEYRYGDLTINGHTVPLTIVTGDQSAAMYAYGKLQFDTAYVNIGTGAFISRPAGYALMYARRLLTSVIYSNEEENQYVIEGTVNGAGSAIEWLQSQFPVDNLWEQLPGWLNDTPNPPLFLNGISGLAAPYWLPEFESELDRNAEPAANYVAVVESIVFLIHANVQEMMKFASPPEQLQISGGLAKLNGLCQRLADLTRLPVYRPLECEATARGTAYLIAGQPAQWPEHEHGIWFEPADNPILDKRFLLWEHAMLQRMRHEDDAA